MCHHWKIMTIVRSEDDITNTAAPDLQLNFPPSQSSSTSLTALIHIAYQHYNTTKLQTLQHYTVHIMYEHIKKSHYDHKIPDFRDQICGTKFTL